MNVRQRLDRVEGRVPSPPPPLPDRDPPTETELRAFADALVEAGAAPRWMLESVEHVVPS